jgi:hypothetical protein
MIRNPQVKQLVGDHEILEGPFLLGEIAGQSDDTFGRARTPLVPHSLDTHNLRIHVELQGPGECLPTQFL